MSNSAKTVLWLGLFMIVAGIARNWSVISSVIFAHNPSGLKVPGPAGVPKSVFGGHCPSPGYYLFNGRCYPASVNPPGQGGGFA